MGRTDKINIVVAETAPVLSAGLLASLRRLPGLQVHPSEVKTSDELADTIADIEPQIVIVNPTFGGVFDPHRLKAAFPDSDFKLVALEIGQLSPHTKVLYDETISVLDDLNMMAEKIHKLCARRNDNQEDKESISQREKEIITLVAKGLTNKEIADALFLSVHTVITHRRNIARKLEIHSATGLTIYAIVNHLVELTDIKNL